jgi:hypothetical protein
MTGYRYECGESNYLSWHRGLTTTHKNRIVLFHSD